MSKIQIVIIGMAIVTCIPRLIPFVFKTNKDLPPWISRFLSFVPCTAIAALAIPGVFIATNSLLASSIGLCFAVIYSWRRGGMMGPILCGIVGTFMTLILI